MQIKCLRVNWLIPALGVGLVAGFAVGATTYRTLERQAEVETASIPILDRLCRDYSLSLVLKLIHEGRVDEAANRLDLLLCWDILRADAELQDTDARTRTSTEAILRMIAQARPKMAVRVDADPTLESGGARQEAERLLRFLTDGAH